MTSKSKDTEAFVWIWLPDETRPVVAGKMVSDGKNIDFNYGKSYLERIHDTPASISIYESELPLKAGLLPVQKGLHFYGCLRDAAPDAWGPSKWPVLRIKMCY